MAAAGRERRAGDSREGHPVPCCVCGFSLLPLYCLPAAGLAFQQPFDYNKVLSCCSDVGREANRVLACAISIRGKCALARPCVHVAARACLLTHETPSAKLHLHMHVCVAPKTRLLRAFISVGAEYSNHTIACIVRMMPKTHTRAWHQRLNSPPMRISFLQDEL